MQKLVDNEFIECAEEELIVGDVYRVSVGGGGWQQQTYAEPEPGIDTYTTDNDAVKVNGNPVQGFSTVYFGVIGDGVTMSFDIVDDDGNLQTQLDSTALGYPSVLALPMLKVANGVSTNVVDEIYFATDLTAGVISVTGSFPSSGNWKLLIDRVNESLLEIGATWAISKQDVTFRINT